MKGIFTFGFLLVMLALQAQDWKQYIREGNEAYAAQNYEDAITSYGKAIDAEADDFAGYLNKGDAYYSSGKWQEAEEEFLNAMSRAKTKEQKASAWHNLGNTYMEQENYEQSVIAYKEALKQHPSDEETRYNLAYAQSKLQEQQQQNENEQQDEEKDEEQQEEEQEDQDEQNNDEQDDEEQEQDQQDKQNQEEGSEQQEQDEQTQPQQPEPMNKEQADRLLRALEREEEKLQEEYNKRKFEIKKGKQTEKDW